MRIKPITEDQADDQTKKIYNGLKEALGSYHVPIFFTYFAPFPEYFAYISDQLIDNLKDPRFKNIIAEMKKDILPLIGEKLEKSEETKSWLNRYQYSPSFYHFQQNNDTIFTINLKLAFVFIALREAVKGWAIAAKKLSSSVSDKKQESASIVEDSFIYDFSSIKEYGTSKTVTSNAPSNTLATKQYGLVKSQSSPLEKDLLEEYFTLCRMDFSEHMKHDYFWILRLGIEKMILQTLPLLPQLINSPINVFFKLTQNYDSSEFLYFLAEHFPTYSIHRLLFSGYMK